MMNNPIVNAERIIKIPGLVSRDYCVLASISQTSQRNGTLWTDADGVDRVVSSKNHHRIDDARSVISIFKSSLNVTQSSSANVEDFADTTAAGMFEIASVDDRYESEYRITSKEYSFISSNQWRSVVYGTPNADLDSSSANIDPYVNLTHDEFILAARVNDAIKNGNTHRPLEKEYRLETGNVYRVSVRSQADIQIGNSLFSRDDMFRTLAAGDTYTDSQGSWAVKEKRVFFMDTIAGRDLYGRELWLTSKAAD